MNIDKVFSHQAAVCSDLGSPFTGQVLRLALAALPEGSALRSRILNWPGDTSGAEESVPLRLAGGFHALVLTGRSQALKAIYPPAASCADEMLHTALAKAMRKHEAFLMDWLNSPPQTNEIARSAPLIGAAQLLADHFDMPLRLLELGCSAGLNLRWDLLAVKTSYGRLGLEDASLTLKPDWQGEIPANRGFTIAERSGADLNPLNPASNEDRQRLLSYLWPDQPERLARMRTGFDLAEAYPAEIFRGDAIDWLGKKLAVVIPGQITVIFHTIAWQYFPNDVQTRGEALIRARGAAASRDAPLVWLSMEADGRAPGAALDLHLWPGNHHIPLGRADFHGRWVTWDAGSTLRLS